MKFPRSQILIGHSTDEAGKKFEVSYGLSGESANNTMGLEYQRNANGDFVCQHCGKVVPKEKQNTMHYHLKKHSGDLPHECGTCGKKFAQKQSLELHIQWNHKDDKEIFECPVAGCTFTATTWANRRIHFLRKHCKHAIDIIQDGHTCKACNKTFNSSTAFFYHAADCIDGNQIPYFQGIM